MALSIIEFGIYGFVCYTSLLMLIISAVKEVPTGRSQSIVRAMFLIPGIFCAFIIAGSGVDINLETNNETFTLNETIYNSTGDITFTTDQNSTTTTTNTITLVDPIWATFHMMIAFVLLVYVVLQMLILFTKT